MNLNNISFGALAIALGIIAVFFTVSCQGCSPKDNSTNDHMSGSGDTLNYTIIYANKTEMVTKYHMVNKSYQVPVYVNVTKEVLCPIFNQTCHNCINVSIGEWCSWQTYTIIDHYDTKWHLVNESYQEEELVPDYCNRIGIVLNGVTCKGIYNVYQKKAEHKPKVYKWRYAQACRNWNEFGSCRSYEEELGICYKTEKYQCI